MHPGWVSIRFQRQCCQQQRGSMRVQPCTCATHMWVGHLTPAHNHAAAQQHKCKTKSWSNCLAADRELICHPSHGDAWCGWLGGLPIWSPCMSGQRCAETYSPSAPRLGWADRLQYDPCCAPCGCHPCLHSADVRRPKSPLGSAGMTATTCNSV